MATYFVAANGSDAANGTSAGTAWQTVGKVNGSSFLPGDQILFRGGDLFSDAALICPSAGGGYPVVYGGYSLGSGLPWLSGGVFLPSNRSGFVVQDILAKPNGTAIQGFASSGSGAACSDVQLLRVTADGCSLGVNMAKAADTRWTVVGATIKNTTDSGMLLLGDTVLTHSCSIVATGTSPPVNTPAHGIYAKGPNQRHFFNVIDGYDHSGVSCRYRNASVVGNYIGSGRDSTATGLAWFQYDSTAGTTRWAYNILNGVKSGVFSSASDVGGNTIENFEILNNTIVGVDPTGNAINMLKGTNLTVANNSVSGVWKYVFAMNAGNQPSGTFVETNNNWFDAGGDLKFGWLGVDYTTLASYQAASGAGSNDKSVDPRLSSVFAAAEASLAAAGTQTGSAIWRQDSSHAPFHYSGAAPDIGALALTV